MGIFNFTEEAARRGHVTIHRDGPAMTAALAAIRKAFSGSRILQHDREHADQMAAFMIGRGFLGSHTGLRCALVQWRYHRSQGDYHKARGARLRVLIELRKLRAAKRLGWSAIFGKGDIVSTSVGVGIVDSVSVDHTPAGPQYRYWVQLRNGGHVDASEAHVRGVGI